MTNETLFNNLLRQARSMPSTGSRLRSNPGFVKYDDNKSLIIISLSENGYLLHLDKKDVTYLGWFYGDPTCAIIDRDSKWAIMAGDHLLAIWNNGILTEIEFRGTFDIRQADTNTVNILIDPWYDNSAIWQFSITTMKFEIIRPFTDYQNREYTDVIIW
jgi:hypothetical protein